MVGSGSRLGVSDMLPFLTEQDFRNCGLADMKLIRNTLLGKSSSTKFSDGVNILRIKFVCIMRFSLHVFRWTFWWLRLRKGSVDHSDAVPNILRRRAPFKVGKAIVFPVPIEVINVVVWTWRLNKSLENSPVNLLINHFSKLAKTYSQITRLALMRLKQFSIPTNIPAIAYFVKAFKSNDRLPVFFHAGQLC